MRAYRAVIERFIQEFGDGPVEQVTPEQVLTFLNRFTEGNKPYTKRIRYSQLSSFFNFVRNNIDPELRNPCDRPMIRKLYRERVPLTDHAFEAFGQLEQFLGADLDLVTAVGNLAIALVDPGNVTGDLGGRR